MARILRITEGDIKNMVKKAVMNEISGELAGRTAFHRFNDQTNTLKKHRWDSEEAQKAGKKYLDNHKTSMSWINAGDKEEREKRYKGYEKGFKDEYAKTYKESRRFVNAIVEGVIRKLNEDFDGDSNTREDIIEPIPDWALSYMINGDPEGLEDDEIAMIDQWQSETGLEVIFPVHDEADDFGAYFDPHPAFGKATNVVDCYCREV